TFDTQRRRSCPEGAESRPCWNTHPATRSNCLNPASEQMPEPTLIIPRKKNERERPRGSVSEVFFVFLHLGLTSFGGPIAHLGYFHDAFVIRRGWLDEKTYADLVALCQFLPGPASSQVGIAIGLSRGGFPGALAAWVAFTLPSAIALVLF